LNSNIKFTRVGEGHNGHCAGQLVLYRFMTYPSTIMSSNS